MHISDDAVRKEQDLPVEKLGSTTWLCPSRASSERQERRRGIPQLGAPCTGERQLTQVSAHTHLRRLTPSPALWVALPVCDMETARALPEISFWWQLWALTASETPLPQTRLESHKNQNQGKPPTTALTPASFYVLGWLLKIRPVSKCEMNDLNKGHR